MLTGDSAFAIVTLGDSITDGHGATTNGNNRWPDVLARRLPHVGVLNAGIGGNRLLDDGLGPNALARFDRDVLAQTAVRYVIMLEGINDLGTFSLAGHTSPADHASIVARIEAAYQQLIARAHAHSLRIYGATITPYTGSHFYHPDAAAEARPPWPTLFRSISSPNKPLARARPLRYPEKSLEFRRPAATILYYELTRVSHPVRP